MNKRVSEAADEVTRLREEVSFWRAEKERHRERVRDLSLQLYRLQTKGLPMLRICKAFDFDAAHFLPNVPDGHKCKRLHGHTYRAEVVLAGEPDERGFIVDYAEIAAAWQPIHDTLDHHLLNYIPGLENPSTEVLAPWILERFVRALPETVAVRVYESSTTWCEATR